MGDDPKLSFSEESNRITYEKSFDKWEKTYILPKELGSESTTVLQASTLFQHVTWYFRKSSLFYLQRSLRIHWPEMYWNGTYLVRKDSITKRYHLAVDGWNPAKHLPLTVVEVEVGSFSDYTQGFKFSYIPEWSFQKSDPWDWLYCWWTLQKVGMVETSICGRFMKIYQISLPTTVTTWTFLRLCSLKKKKNN